MKRPVYESHIYCSVDDGLHISVRAATLNQSSPLLLFLLLQVFSVLVFLRNSRNRVLPENPTDPQQVKKFPTFYKKRKFVTSIHNSQPTSLILSQINPVQVSPSLFLKVHFVYA